jgi:hypothetical protein
MYIRSELNLSAPRKVAPKFTIYTLLATLAQMHHPSIVLLGNNFFQFPDPISWENEPPVLSRAPARGAARGPRGPGGCRQWPDDAKAPAEPENRLAATFHGRLSGGPKTYGISPCKFEVAACRPTHDAYCAPRTPCTPR